MVCPTPHPHSHLSQVVTPVLSFVPSCTLSLLELPLPRAPESYLLYEFKLRLPSPSVFTVLGKGPTVIGKRNLGLCTSLRWQAQSTVLCLCGTWHSEDMILGDALTSQLYSWAGRASFSWKTAERRYCSLGVGLPCRQPNPSPLLPSGVDFSSLPANLPTPAGNEREALNSTPVPQEKGSMPQPGLVAHTCNPNSWEAEAGGPQV